MPDAAAGKVAVLVLGFTHASKEPTGAWSRKIETDLARQSGFELYQVPVLEEVPRMIRGMVISGMKTNTSENLRGNFVPVLHGEAELKKLVNYQQPDDAYLIVLDRTGKIAYRMHGALSDANYAQLRQHVDSLLK